MRGILFTTSNMVNVVTTVLSDENCVELIALHDVFISTKYSMQTYNSLDRRFYGTFYRKSWWSRTTDHRKKEKSITM